MTGRSPKRLWSGLWLILVSSLAPAFAHAAPWKKGPYLQWVTPTSATVMWEPSGPSVRGILEMTGPGEGHGMPIQKPQANGMFEATIDGLRPATEYRWKLTLGADSVGGRFKTAPAARGPATFVVYGDNRSDHRAHEAVLTRITQTVPDFLVSTGDLVGHGGSQRDWAKFFEISTGLLRDTPLFPVVGNHDVYDNGERSFARYFHLPGNELYYAFTWGSVRFIAIDAEVSVERDTHRPDAAHRQWLVAEVRKAAADPQIDHVVAFVHRGPFSSNPRRSGNAGLRRMLPELQAAGLTLLLSGHDHYYERGVSNAGLNYLVIGGGGAPLYETAGAGQHVGYRALVSRSVHSFVRFRLHGKTLSGCAVDLTGAPFDCFEYVAP